MGKEYDFVGKKFGKLTVIERVSNRNTRQSWWMCECDCGNKKEIRGIKLATQHTTSCGCLRKSKPAYNYTGLGELSGKYWARIKRHAKTRELSFNLSIEDAWSIYEQQKNKCALSGLEIRLFRNLELGHQTASLDRIDSSKGYFKENVQWVHLDVNKIKNNLPEDRLFHLCKLITEKRLEQA